MINTVVMINLLFLSRHFQVRTGKQHNVIATGGKENELHLWDLNVLERPVFQAKNVPNDKLELRVPVWISGIAFCPENPSRVSVVSKHGHVRQYDVRSGQRRPVLAFEWEGEAPTACSATGSAHQILVGAGTGKLAMFDWRKTGKKDSGMAKKYKGCVGSIRCIRSTGDESRPYFATAGLDRYLRIYDVNSAVPVQKMYLKSKLNCLLLNKDFDPTFVPESSASEANKEVSKDDVLERDTTTNLKTKGSEENVQEDEKFWTKMKIIREKPKKRKGKQSESSAKRKR